MEFYDRQLFHIYNQGNNRRQIFFSEENYLYFLWKMRSYLIPYGDLVAWCLMPNHFHWLFFVKKVEIQRSTLREHVDHVEQLRGLKKYGANARTVERAHTRVAKGSDTIILNDAIGILQKAYARAINKEMGWTGSVFRRKFKAKDGWIDEFVTLRKPDGRLDSRFMPGTGYAYKCFCYIHDNPKEAGLVNTKEGWAYSSARDYAGLRKGTLCNLEMGRDLVSFL